MKLFLKSSFVFLFLSLTANAKPYFDGKTISPTLLNPPYKINSKEWNNDVDQIAKMQKQVDPAELTKAQEEKDVKPELITLTIDKNLTRAAYPKLYHLLDRVSETTYDSAHNAKVFWFMKRPYLESAKVKALIEKSYSPAYPSGHTTFSFTQAKILSEIFPAKRSEFFKRADEISNHRVLVGMHYVQDVAAGKDLSLLVTGALMQNQDFLDDFDAAKEEVESLK